MAKILILGDLHGEIPNIHFRDFDSVLCVGDICNIDFQRDIQFGQLELKKKDPPYQMKEWFSFCGKKKARKLVTESINQGRRVLEFLNSLKVPVYIVPGNADWTSESSAWNFLKEDHFRKMLSGLKNIKNVHNKILKTSFCQIIGYGLSSGPEYPQTKEDLNFFSESQLERRKKNLLFWSNRMKILFERSRRIKLPLIFLSHNVPFNTAIDKILLKNSPRYGYHYGSVVVRSAIEKYAPLFCVGGHMHEHFGKTNVGKTVCVNAGFGKDATTMLEMENGKITSLQFYDQGK